MEQSKILKIGHITEGKFPKMQQNGSFTEMVFLEGYILENWEFEKEGRVFVIPLVGVQYKDADDIFGYDVFELQDIIDANYK